MTADVYDYTYNYVSAISIAKFGNWGRFGPKITMKLYFAKMLCIP